MTRSAALYDGRTKDKLTIVARLGPNSWLVDCACGVSYVSTSDKLKSKFMKDFTACNDCARKHRDILNVGRNQGRMLIGTWRTDTPLHPEHELNMMAAKLKWR